MNYKVPKLQPDNRLPRKYTPAGVENDLASLDSRAGDLENDLVSLDSRAGDLEDTVVSLGSRAGDLEDGLVSLDSRTGDLEDDLASLDSRVGDLENTVENGRLSETAIAGQVGSQIAGTVPGLIADQIADANPFVEKEYEEFKGSTNMSNDGELGIVVQSSSTYTVDALILYDADEAGGIKITFSIPSGTLYWCGQGLAPNWGEWGGGETISVVSPHDTSAVFGSAGVDVPVAIRVTGTLKVGSTGGDFRFRWAQNVTAGNPTKVLSGSWMRLTRVS